MFVSDHLLSKCSADVLRIRWAWAQACRRWTDTGVEALYPNGGGSGPHRAGSGNEGVGSVPFLKCIGRRRGGSGRKREGSGHTLEGCGIKCEGSPNPRREIHGSKC